MLYVLIWVLIIAVVIWSEVKKQRSRQGGGARQQPDMRQRVQQGAGRAMQTYQNLQGNYQRSQQNYPNAQRSQQSYQNPRNQNPRQGNPVTGQELAAMTAKQRELKNRLTQRYGRPADRGTQGMGQQKNQQRPVGQPNDILSRAAANVRENEQDQLEMEMDVRHPGSVMTRDAHDLIGAVDISEGSELMCQVSDLMIMGYQADLTFERDFVSEGVEMLNSYELPTGA